MWRREIVDLRKRRCSQGEAIEILQEWKLRSRKLLDDVRQLEAMSVGRISSSSLTEEWIVKVQNTFTDM